jgi:hypothetical protein
MNITEIYSITFITKHIEVVILDEIIAKTIQRR